MPKSDMNLPLLYEFSGLFQSRLGCRPYRFAALIVLGLDITIVGNLGPGFPVG